MSTTVERCGWVSDDPLYVRYHDSEWGVPVHDDRVLFEFLILEGAQAGLSWITVLKRREGYRTAFANFDVKTVASFDDKKVIELLENPNIVRHSLKIRSAISNAKIVLALQKEFGSFSAYLWGFVGNKPITARPKTLTDVPSTSALAVEISKDLKKRGMSFVGPTIVYAYLQAVGVVNDHVKNCFKSVSYEYDYTTHRHF